MTDGTWALEMNMNVRAYSSELDKASNEMRLSANAFSRSSNSPLTLRALQSKQDSISDGMGRVAIGMYELGVITDENLDTALNIKNLVEISYALLILYQAYVALSQGVIVQKLIEAVAETAKVMANPIYGAIVVGAALGGVAWMYGSLGPLLDSSQSVNEINLTGGSMSDPMARRQMARDTYRGVRA